MRAAPLSFAETAVAIAQRAERATWQVWWSSQGAHACLLTPGKKLLYHRGFREETSVLESSSGSSVWFLETQACRQDIPACLVRALWPWEEPETCVLPSLGSAHPGLGWAERSQVQGPRCKAWPQPRSGCRGGPSALHSQHRASAHESTHQSSCLPARERSHPWGLCVQCLWGKRVNQHLRPWAAAQTP